VLEDFPELKHRITAEAYHRMGEAGVLAADARTELIEGEILDTAPIGSRHASSSQRLDRRVKVPLYARHGVPQVWVIDLENGLVHFHSRPDGGAYADICATERPGATPVAALPGVSIDLSGML